MTKTEKTAVIEELKEKFIASKYFYITDCSTLPVSKINALRRQCFEKGIKLCVAKNKLIKKALEWAEMETKQEYSELFSALAGASAIMFAETGSLPAKLIKDFRGDNAIPALKAAYIDSAVFLGEESLETLLKIKSKEQLIGDIILALQSPINNVIGALQSGGNTITGLLKTLEERGEAA